MTTAQKTEAETHEQQLARLHDEVEALREQLKRAQRLATVGTMTAMVVHEFNNILTPIINYAKLARNNPSFVEKAIARAEDGGQRATNICRAILDMAREDSSDPVEVNVPHLISETLEAMARDPQKDGIKLTLDAPADLTVSTRRVELQQVILNLLINARAVVLERSAPRLIGVSAERDGNKIVIRVSDNGAGIQPENLERIFEPFFTTKKAPSGHLGGDGLGLSICREIITSLGGQILVESTPGEGATFTIHLPA
ncbi:MAG: HAMP domain-containing histidine kinase [Phycisphaerae bacterium]|nr:HAMP domain-containing histidine kinase [Phycisphaerae bacterium]